VSHGIPDTVPNDTVPNDTTARPQRTPKNFVVYPSPSDAGGAVYLRFPSLSAFVVEIYDAHGRLRRRQPFTPTRGDYLIADDLAAGLYTVKVHTADGAWASQPIVVR
jgi:hypothetical protein